jgi:mono/diheme cytochrome c family protein
VFAAGPFSALVAAEHGLYIAESGWLIEPAWRDALEPDDVVASALGSDAVAWIGSGDGLFRIEGGELSELKAEDGSISGISALAVAPAEDGSNAVWFAQAGELRYARQTARTGFEIGSAGLDAKALGGGILALASVSAAPDSRGELWLITPQALFRHSEQGWQSFDPPAPPKALISAGRFVWLQAGAGLYRYDADAADARWSRIEGVGSDLSLLAADASGSLWLRMDGDSFNLSSGAVPRLFGLFEGMRVYATDVRVRAQLSAADEPSSVSFTLDDGEQVLRSASEARASESGPDTLEFALGGFDPAGQEQSYSLAGFAPGMHTLRVSASTERGEESRQLHFEFRAADASALSFARDVQPIYEARCAKCHMAGPGHALNDYEEWVAEKDKLVRAVVELRMPADGPLDPSQIQIIQRWAAGGAAP